MFGHLPETITRVLAYDHSPGSLNIMLQELQQDSNMGLSSIELLPSDTRFHYNTV